MTSPQPPDASSAAPAEPLITVDVWADLVCPWCYIGEGRLHEAIERAGLAGEVALRVHSFELDPSAVAAGESGAPTNIDYLSGHRGMDRDQVLDQERQVGELAAELGRGFRPERPMASTRAIHRVLQALTDQVSREAASSWFLGLQRDYFADGLDPFDEEVVLERAVAAGLSETVARAAHRGDAYDDAVTAEMDQAIAMGARGVPFFVFDDTYTAPGAAPTEAFVQALEQLAEENRSRA